MHNYEQSKVREKESISNVSTITINNNNSNNNDRTSGNSNNFKGNNLKYRLSTIKPTLKLKLCSALPASVRYM